MLTLLPRCSPAPTRLAAYFGGRGTYNCAANSLCQTDQCFKRCCTAVGVTVNFICKRNASQFYIWHLHLYSIALRPIFKHHLFTKLHITETGADVKVQNENRIGGKLDVQRVLADLPKQWLPRCAIRNDPPENMRV